MDKFALEIELGETMNSAHDIAEALRGVADRLEKKEYRVDQHMIRAVLDKYGNMTGAWMIVPNKE